jgi:hypothetical protein
MASESALTPRAFSAGQIDFADHSFAHPALVVGLQNLTYKLVTWRASEAVVAALQLNIGVADSAIQQAD